MTFIHIRGSSVQESGLRMILPSRSGMTLGPLRPVVRYFRGAWRVVGFTQTRNAYINPEAAHDHGHVDIDASPLPTRLLAWMTHPMHENPPRYATMTEVMGADM